MHESGVGKPHEADDSRPAQTALQRRAPAHPQKSIDLEYLVWQRLAALAQRRGVTLSETIVQLIEDAEHKEKYASQMSLLRQDLQAMLNQPPENE